MPGTMPLLAALLHSTPANGAQIELTRSQLCAHSERVVIAEVTDIETRWTTRGRIERLVHLTVDETLLGPPSDDVELLLPGGKIGDLEYSVEHAPNLLIDAQYLLFVSERKDVVGGEQGAIRITPSGARVGEPREAARASVEVCREP
jgi:hypothetical protein